MKTVFAVTLTLFAAAASGAVSQAAEPSAAAVLDANHAAVGELPTAGSMTLDFSHTGSGLTGPAVLHFDLATGAFDRSQDAGGLHSSDGFDGKTPWQQDISLAYTPEQGGDRIPVAVSVAYRNANLWWRVDRGGAQLSYVARETVDGRALDHLLVAPKDGKRFDAWFDVGSHLLTNIAYDQQFFRMNETFEDFRREGGVMLAHKIKVDPGFGSEGVETWELNAMALGPARPLSDYAMPREAPTGATIASGAASATVPFRLLNNHIYVQAEVDGKGPYTFIVDTGGHTLLSPQLIKAVGLKAVGEGVSNGGGEGHSTLGFVHFREIAIGSVRLSNQMGFATEIYDPSIEGIRVDGMVGFELIRRMVTTIDYGKQTITFTDPRKFEPGRTLGVALPFVFDDHLPNVSGDVAGVPARFEIDTGSRSQVDFTSPFVKTQSLKSRYTKGATVVTGWGVGGPSRSYVVRLSSMKLGSVEVTNIAAGLSEDKGGALVDPNFDGNVGSGLLKQFVVTFDYAHQIIYLKRITPTPADVGTFDRSGLWINAKDGGYEVTDVARGSAGADAGMKVGDVITSFDGRPTTADQLANARKTLRNKPAGTAIALRVRRGSETRAVTLTLRDQI